MSNEGQTLLDLGPIIGPEDEELTTKECLDILADILADLSEIEE